MIASVGLFAGGSIAWINTLPVVYPALRTSLIVSAYSGVFSAVKCSLSTDNNNTPFNSGVAGAVVGALIAIPKKSGSRMVAFPIGVGLFMYAADKILTEETHVFRNYRRPFGFDGFFVRSRDEK